MRQSSGLLVLYGLLLALLGWAGAAALISDPFMLPSPQMVIFRLIQDLSTPLLWHSIGQTALEACLGCLLGAVIAIPLAYLFFKSRIIAGVLSPSLAASQAIPAVALAPLLVLWVGYGLLPIVLLCALIVFFPILVSTLSGLKNLDEDIISAARLDGAGGWRLWKDIEFPLTMPSVFAGLRSGFTLSITGAVVGEFVMGGSGLGSRLSAQANVVDVSGLFGTILVLCILAATLYGSLVLLENQSPTVRAIRTK
ncbi:ABC transporter permease [Boudabousia tangfeifanii]|uniref:ABC transporter permease n=1 Tax=Boudabousia tangfeifanii TaxID=1912795 RepID=UPI000A889D01|nr:ABC transporter permease [Boudabousia tangfeifanii]